MHEANKKTSRRAAPYGTWMKVTFYIAGEDAGDIASMAKAGSAWRDKYELSMYDDGQFIGRPEQAFRISANVYLNER
jgi:hypothetical protein